jgi:hypothetical protein
MDLVRPDDGMMPSPSQNHVPPSQPTGTTSLHMYPPIERRISEIGGLQSKERDTTTTMTYIDRPRIVDKHDSDRSISTTATDLFEMDPWRRDSVTTVDSYEEPMSPLDAYEQQSSPLDASTISRSATLRPVIVRGSKSDEQRKTVGIDLERKDDGPTGPLAASSDQDRDHKGVVAQGKDMLEHGIENLATRFRSFGFTATKQTSNASSEPEWNRPSSASGSESRSRLANSDSAKVTPSVIGPSNPDPSYSNHNVSTGASLFIGRLRPGSTDSHLSHHSHQHQQQHPQLAHLESDITPRAEFPPSLKSHSPGSTTETIGSPSTQRKSLRYSSTNEDETDEDNPGPSSSSRNSTIRRKRDSSARKSLLLIREKPSGRSHTEIVEPSRKGSAGGGYFPDVEQLKKKAKRERDAEKARKKSEALAKRARASALATFATSPRSASSFAFRSTSKIPSPSADPVSSKGAVESPSESENSGTDEMETPWPSSARHGDTPLGLEHEMIKSSRASSIRERMSSMGSVQEHGRSPFQSRKNSLDRRSSSEILTDEDEVLQAGTGCAISIPLAPPPGYPLYSPSIGSDMSERPWLRPGSYASSSANASPPTGVNPAVTSLQPLHQHIDKAPYGHYFAPSGPIETHTSGLDGDWARKVADGFEPSAQGLAMSRSTSNSCCSSITSASGMGASDSPHLHADSGPDGSSPFEGKITIDTGHDRYIISVGEMAGFSLENITIAVKNINRSSSSSSSAPRLPFAHQKSGDATSIHSQSSVRSTSSFPGLDRAAVPRTASPDVVSEGKVLHLIADRWEDSGER